MRPKKLVLIVDADENRNSILNFTLSTWGFNVTAAAGCDEALDALSARRFDLIVCNWPMPRAAELLTQARAIDEGTHSLVLAHGVLEPPVGCFAHAILLTRIAASKAELFDRVKLLTARKRGPRRKPVLAVDETAEERRIA